MYVGVQRGLSSQRGSERKEALDRAADVGQCERAVRQRRLGHGDSATVSGSLHIHRLHGGRLARQTALRAATSRSAATRRPSE